MNSDSPNTADIVERPVSKSIIEEVVGVLWAILATLTASKIIAIFAWGMAGISLAAAVYYALKDHRKAQA